MNILVPVEVEFHRVFVVDTHAVAVHVWGGSAYSDVRAGAAVVAGGGGAEGTDTYTVVVGEA